MTTKGAPLHPESLLMWEQVVEGNPPRAVCHHCGEPVPCIDRVLRHQQTDEHHWVCLALASCRYEREHEAHR